MYKVILAIRFLVKRRISYFAVAATGLCVFVAFVVITVLSGLTAEFKGYIYRCYGDCVVSSKSLVGFGHYEEFTRILESTEIVEAVSPVIRGYANIEVASESESIKKGGGASTAQFVGIYPGAHSRVTGLGQWLCLHRMDVKNAFRPSYDVNLPGVVPGAAFLFECDWEGCYDVAKELPRVEFQVSVFPLTAKGTPARAGLGEISSKTFYCSDYTHTGHRSDWNVVCLPFDEAQRLCGMYSGPKRVSSLYVKFRPGVGLGKGCERIAKLWDAFVKEKGDAKFANLLENVRVQSWKTHNRAIVAMADTEETFMIVIFGMIGIITGFIVFVVFYMIVSHKSKDIGILKSLGVSDASVLLLFLGFGLLVGIVGSGLGAVAGWQYLENIEQIERWFSELLGFRFWYGGGHDIGNIPNQISVAVLVVVVVSVIVGCLFGAAIPSWRAARLKPIEALQVTQL